ncbi:hypothetical protein YC2023_000128 [Brassica napus]
MLPSDQIPNYRHLKIKRFSFTSCQVSIIRESFRPLPSDSEYHIHLNLMIQTYFHTIVYRNLGNETCKQRIGDCVMACRLCVKPELHTSTGFGFSQRS